MNQRLTIAILLVPFVAACAETSGEATTTATFDTLPNGAVLVHNTAEGVWDSASAWRFVEETRIGAIDGDGPDVFGDVRDIEPDALGRVWILDSQAKAIRVFEQDGRFVRTIGRAGSGPGELEYPIGIEFDPQGRAWVLDPDNGRFTVYDTAGGYVASHRRESMSTPWIWRGGITNAGVVFDFDNAYDGEHPEGREVLIRYDSAGVVRDTLPLPAFAQATYELRNDGTLMQTAPVPFAPRLGWQLAPDGALWFGSTGEYRLVSRGVEGDTLRIVEKDWTPLPVTAEERDERLSADYLQEMKRRGADIDPGRVPANKPAWGSFWFDDLGYLWVIPTQQNEGELIVDVFDPDGRFLGELSFGDLKLGMIPTVRGDRLYTVVRDELGVPYVVIGRLVGRD